MVEAAAAGMARERAQLDAETGVRLRLPQQGQRAGASAGERRGQRSPAPGAQRRRELARADRLPHPCPTPPAQ